jgi:hypothetical protein
MLKKILIALAVLIAVLVVIILKQPDEFKVSRTTTLAAHADVIFDQINDLHKWEAWSPWAKLDPNAKSSYDGPDAGVGTSMSWDGNRSVGAGSMKIIENRTNEFVKYQLDFLKPMKATNTAEITLKSEGENTTITWSMYGHSNFISKAMNLVFNCEKMVGDQFNQGFANLKTIVEKK